MRNTGAVLAVVLAAIWLGGCSSVSRPIIMGSGIPEDKYLVGGGWEINYTAPADGTVCLVERSSYKLLETTTVEEGDTYEKSIDPHADELEALGISPKTAKFQLFFVPAPKGKNSCKVEE